MSSNQYTVNIVNADELYIGGNKIQALDLGSLVTNDDIYGVGIGTDKPRLKLDISGNSGIRIPVGTTAVRPTNTTLTGSGATNLLGVLRYNTTTEKYEAVYKHESLSVNPSWCNFVIEADNKVGINRGTTAPLQTLDVNGSIGINDYIIHNGNTTSYFGFPGNNIFFIITDGSERMRVASNGYIGIGTINAASLLHVFNATDQTLDLSLYSMNRYTSASNSATNIYYNYLENTLVSNSAPDWSTVPRYGFKLGSWRNLTNSGLILKTIHAAGGGVDWKTRLKVNNDGFFYFNSPDSYSHNYYSPYHFSFKPVANNKYGDLPPSVNDGNSKINDLTFSNFGIAQADSKNIFGEYPVFIGKGCTLYSDNNPTLANTKFIAFSEEGSPSSNSQTFYGGGIMLNDKIHFITYNTSNNNSPPGNKLDSAGNTIYDGLELQLSTYTRMTIDETGNVGIGTTSPSYKLDVEGTLRVTGTITGNVTGNLTGTASVASKVIITDNANSQYHSRLAMGAPGYTSSGDTLYIPDSWEAPMYKPIENKLYVSSVVLSSDRRIKKDIRPIPDALALDILRRLDVKYYKYMREEKNNLHDVIGFIAQEVLDILPGAVTIDKGTIPYLMSDIDVKWENIKNGGYTMTVLSRTLEPGEYNFVMDNEKHLMLETTDGTTFKTENKYSKVYVSGKTVVDFHRIDKTKIFAIAYSATQEIDKIQQAEKAKLTATETKLEEAEAKIATLENTLADVLTRLAALE